MKLDLPQLESWLWEASYSNRGPVDAPKFKDYILPLIFLKLLSYVFDNEITGLAEEFGSAEKAPFPLPTFILKNGNYSHSANFRVQDPYPTLLRCSTGLQRNMVKNESRRVLE